MKRIFYFIIVISVLGFALIACQQIKPVVAKAPENAEPVKTEPEKEESPQIGESYLNPDLLDGTSRDPIITHIYTADPTARAFEGRIYLYASHDLDDQKDYWMDDYHVFSTDDLVNWQDHGVVLDAKKIWASTLYAPDCVYDEKSGKYYLYYPNGGSNIGVAVSENPAGPFTDVLGGPLIKPSYPGAGVAWCFDPSVLIDDDGQSYLYFGGGMPETGDNARVIRLNDDMVSLKDSAATKIIAPDYFEAPFVFKRNGKYYFTYSTNWNGHPILIDYMMSDDPMTGWEYKGTVINNPPDNQGNNNHHSLVEYKGTWYVFYHNRKLAISRKIKGGFQRSVTMDRIDFMENGEIIKANLTKGTIPQLKNVDAFSRLEAELIAAQYGINIKDIFENNAKTGVTLSDIHNGDWTAVSMMDFGAGAETFTASVAAANEGSRIELWIDGGEENGGSLIGTCGIPATGGLWNWQEVSCSLSPVEGVHNLYLIYRGPVQADQLFHFDYYRFD